MSTRLRGERRGHDPRLRRVTPNSAPATNFSFLRGASHPEEMVARAAELGLPGSAIADRNTLAGVVRAHVFRAREPARRWRGCGSSSARGSPSATARPTCSPIPATAPPMAGCAGC